MISDLRYAFRTLRRAPGFTTVAVLALALGIGATTAIFAVLDSVALDPLPYPEPDRLVRIDSRVPGYQPGAIWGVSVAGYFHFQEEERAFESIGAYVYPELTHTTESGAHRIGGAVVTASLLDALRARPALGRLIEAEDDRPGAPPVALLGHAFWRRAYGADPGVIGSTIELNDMPYEIVGVVAPGLRLPDRPVDVWLPFALDPTAPAVNAHFLNVIGRLSPGITAAAAERDMTRLTAQLMERFPTAYTAAFMRDTEFSTRVIPLRDFVIGDVAGVLWILLCAVGLVLVIACANVANLFLTRMQGRRRELAVRAALGAGRARLTRHRVAEGVILGALAGVIGAALAFGGVHLLLALAPESLPLPRLREVEIDAAALGFAAVLSLAVGAMFGFLRLPRSEVEASVLRETSRGLTFSRGQHRVRRALIVGQVALALVLLAAAGLMLRSLERLRDVDPGLDPANVLAVELSVPARRYDDYAAVERFYRALLERVEALPGVQAAGAASGLPLEGIGVCAAMAIRDRPLRGADAAGCIPYAYVAPGFFRTLRVPVRGHEPEWADVESRSGDVIITRALAERLWPAGDAIGKGIRGNGRSEPYYRVAGVTDHLYETGLDEAPVEAVFFPMLPIDGAPLWSPPRSMTLLVKTGTVNPAALTTAIRGAVADLDPAVPLGTVRTMEHVVAQSMADRAFSMLLLAIAAAMGLLLSAIGLYGVISYVVGERTGEIGLRRALGAQDRAGAGMVVRQSVGLTLAGIAAGLAGALLATRVLRSLLFDVSPTDPLTLAAVSAVLLGVALVAAYLPARRAARVDPMVALRGE